MKYAHLTKTWFSVLALVMAFGLPAAALAAPIFRGFDLFVTVENTSVAIPNPMHPTDRDMDIVIPLMGVPLFPGADGLGDADTIVFRKQGLPPGNDPMNPIDSFDFPHGEGTVDIELVGLYLKSMEPVDLSRLGGSGNANLFAVVNREIENIPASGGNDDGICDPHETCKMAAGNNLPFPIEDNSAHGGNNDGICNTGETCKCDSTDELIPSTRMMTIRHESSDSEDTQGTFDVSQFSVFACLVFTSTSVEDLRDPHAVVLSMPMPMPSPEIDLSGDGEWSHMRDPDPQKNPPNNAMFPDGGFFVSVIMHNGPHIVGPSAIELVSFTAEVGADGSIALTWETATEIDNAGFNLYRATTEDGPYTQINDALIPAEGDAVSGASYSFMDTPGSGTFYYQLEDVDFNGVSTLHDPVVVEVRP